MESVKSLLLELLKSIQEKIEAVDTTVADRSRGDVKQLRELPLIQDSITKLEALIEQSDESYPAYANAVGTIIKSLLYINQYSQVFKDAYRNKKTMLMMKYQSLILSVISSVTYLVSTIVAYNYSEVHIKATSADIESFPPLVTLQNFIRSVDSGEFKVMTRDVNVLREFHLEVSVETMGMVLEAAEFAPMIIDSIKSLLSSFGLDSSKLTNILYKVAGVVVLLLSLRDSLYTFFRMQFKAGEMLSGLQNFVNSDSGNGGILSKLSQFSKRFQVDAENGAEVSRREI
jgi:hypothetical protein